MNYRVGLLHMAGAMLWGVLSPAHAACTLSGSYVVKVTEYTSSGLTCPSIGLMTFSASGSATTRLDHACPGSTYTSATGTIPKSQIILSTQDCVATITLNSYSATLFLNSSGSTFTGYVNNGTTANIVEGVRR